MCWPGSRMRKRDSGNGALQIRSRKINCFLLERADLIWPLYALASEQHVPFSSCSLALTATGPALSGAQERNSQ